jgi:hypothetical protein
VPHELRSVEGDFGRTLFFLAVVAGFFKTSENATVEAGWGWVGTSATADLQSPVAQRM